LLKLLKAVHILSVQREIQRTYSVVSVRVFPGSARLQQKRVGKLCMHLEARTFGIEHTENYACRLRFLQVVDDLTGDTFRHIVYNWAGVITGRHDQV